MKGNTDTNDSFRFEKVFRPGGLELTKYALEISGLTKGHRVLDVGCGRGSSMQLMDRIYGIVPVGIDLSKDMVQAASAANPRAEVFQGDGCALPFEECSFDGVLMECTLSLMESKRKALLEAYRVLKVGGKLIVSGLYPKDQKGTYFDLFRETGFPVIFFEDRHKDLVQFVGQIIFQFGGLEEYRRQMDLEGLNIFGVGEVCGEDCFARKNTGYFLLICEKRGE